MSDEDPFDKVPENIRRFRFEDAAMWYSKDGNNELDVYAEKIGEGVHLHMFFNGDKAGAVLTNLRKRGTPEEHTPFSIQDFFTIIAKMCELMFKNFEQVDPADTRYKRRKVEMCIIPKVKLNKIRAGKAYFELDTEIEECLFSEIDTSRPQIGVLKGWLGRETALILVGNGNIFMLELKRLKEISKQTEKQLLSLGWNRVYRGS